MKRIRSKIYNTLRKSEKYTQTDMVYLAKGGSWLFLLQGITSMSSFILALIFANLSTAESYGEYKFITSMFGLLSIFTLPGINTALIRYISKNGIFSTNKIYQYKTKWGLIASVISIIISIYYFINQNDKLGFLFLITSLFLPITNSLDIYQSVLNGKKKFKELSLYQATIQITSILIMSFTIYLTDNITFIIISYFIPLTISKLFFFKKTTRIYEDKNLFSNQEYENIIKYGKNLTFIDILNLISTYFDKILIFTNIGSAQLAIYSFAIAIPDQLKGLVSKISVLAMPKFSEKTLFEIKKTIWKKYTLWILLLFILSIIYILICPIIYKIFFPKYIDSALLSQIFGLSIVSFAVFVPIDILKSLEKTKELYILNISSSIFKILVLVLLLKLLGLTGIVIAWVLSRFFNLIFATILLYKTTD